MVDPATGSKHSVKNDAQVGAKEKGICRIFAATCSCKFGDKRRCEHVKGKDASAIDAKVRPRPRGKGKGQGGDELETPLQFLPPGQVP